MKSIAAVGAWFGLTVLSACSGQSEDAGDDAGMAGESGATSGGSGSGGVGGTTSGNGGSGGVAGTTSGNGGFGGVAGTTSGNGGSAGVAGSGGGSSCGCVEEELSWGPNGGFVAYQETSTLEPCHTFTLVRQTFESDPMMPMCTDPIDSCDDIVDPGDIQAALEHPDVVAAFASSPVLFGYDTRPVDGTVFQVHLGSRLVEIGRDCAGSADCTDAPAGVVTLRESLETLTMQLLARPPCSDVF